MSAQQISQTILQQLGGARFKTMTGAKSFVYGEHAAGAYLRFDLPRGMASNKATTVVVTLTPADVYQLDFFKMNYKTREMVAVGESIGDVYAEDLQRIFTEQTGLYTSL